MDPSSITFVRRAFRSGSSDFWRARLVGPSGFSRPVLIKRLGREHAADARLIERERTEALLTARLVHPNILPVLDYGVLDGQPITVLEDVRAVELLHLLERATVERRRFAPRLALGIGWAVLQALAYAHTRADPGLGIVGIAHGDLSPTNIFIEASGRVLVRDFGVPLPLDAHRSGNGDSPPAEPLARLGRLYGRPGYMCPELVTRGLYGPRSDLFALGILLFELLTFRRLFAGRDGAETLKAVALAQVDERISRHAGDLPMPLREVMRKALRRQPDERFASASEMLRMLEAFFPGSPHDVAPELAHFVQDVAPPHDEDELEASNGAAVSTPRQRSGRRAPSRLILPAAADEAEAQAAENEAAALWSDTTPPPQLEVEALLAEIEPVGPPPLPSDA